MLAEGLTTPVGAWTLAAAATALAALESAFVPWAPFLILYALSLPWPALALGTARFGPPGSVFALHPGTVAGLSLAILAWEAGLMGFAYEKWVRRRGGPLPRFSPVAALDALMEEAARRHRLSPRAIQAWSAAYFLVWAPLAEELFFWGLLYPAWRPGYGAVAASAFVAVWFALRHGAHLLLLRPYPWPAALAFMASAGGAAFGNGLLFEACGSLWPLIALHFASNLLSLAAAPGPPPGLPESVSARLP
jgi:membrane protease YdiL (CAAX protease family)